ncbi:MAG: nitrogen fixation protein NifZ [Sterolibacteriaceae bacterium]|uniref:Nitrogen fixation protein NifZ n=1 Tax=Candidatus Methylophosphatis roskildensis TaxID=2899263 RepID=A0A9D7E0A8_9PROT|nr:nitrogen fixation protein NifZ [Candidatus Methylophosphatis roskildensis]MBK7236962.1 nitrogen fixation protein NifZ [Sterolibacteriaceae bacterium]MBK7665719.1 nitrogen fixation protein NifZ [Sterolibacteriaceae bacterium]MBK9085959.1 nitrogen fixation protein NifZ [Sterolibacteriaceae bacterium]
MADVRLPKYREGQRVVAAAALFNDGSHPEREADALLVEAGSTGEVVQVGHHIDENLPIYMVDFVAADGRPCVVGCLEEELVSA